MILAVCEINFQLLKTGLDLKLGSKHEQSIKKLEETYEKKE